ncbi:hypothetical protein [Actinomadura parmotrematis]|uniref:Phospholipid carrier-dependent glycosyltransferase n=1 Tax=Actinomadura parmotrematis TaxID=2864039 RepID=A0ABS7FMQ0_9ACTN|nr:hypothetical protein [Actinomadura parmotrematis]MBW8481649.1 hypothetical protein [Actinomadura parmotrematis]
MAASFAVRATAARATAVRATAGWRAHRPFLALITAAVLLRLIAMAGYTPAMWFTDSFNYVQVALWPTPDMMRPDGYPFLLLLLRPFHSFALVVFVQHLMGLGAGAMIYLLLRRRFGLPGWGASLAAAPVLLDAYQIQLEQLIMSDTLFMFLLVSAVTLLLWHGRPGKRVAAAAGLLVGLVWLTRSVGMPVLFGVLFFLIVRRTPWRTVAVLAVACLVPVVAYMGWYKVENGRFTVVESGSLMLYSRVSKFADCHKMDVPVEEMPLCVEPANRMRFSQDSLWQRASPLNRYSGSRFGREKIEVAGPFARRAILAQPGDYLKVVGTDFLRSFTWNRPVFPDRATYDRYRFRATSEDLGEWPSPSGGTATDDAERYEHGPIRTRVNEPFAGIMRGYQSVAYLPGTLLGVLLLVGLGVVASTWRRWGRRAEKARERHGTLAALLPWALGTGLLLAPAATAEFDYRYILPTVPLACIAAALAFTPEARAGLARRFRRRAAAPAEPAAQPATAPAESVDGPA